MKDGCYEKNRVYGLYNGAADFCRLFRAVVYSIRPAQGVPVLKNIEPIRNFDSDRLFMREL